MNEVRLSQKHLYTGLLLLITGFIVMALGNETYSFWKLTASPILLMGGYVFIGWSIMKKSTKAHV